ncbi:hypothetical protein QBC34DRAFT_319050 [Podospora aff. communis PSN243]|uniref:Uncharacterized protein n=1 Tax=Podospora aff. communis PSN243 TaxID=3040156 RepID=A0AAV9GY74_9PEZI|nr:hypothetical protein QBC34DRAFT_319050 [Podospora aff. communis PSN243]
MNTPESGTATGGEVPTVNMADPKVTSAASKKRRADETSEAEIIPKKVKHQDDSPAEVSLLVPLTKHNLRRLDEMARAAAASGNGPAKGRSRHGSSASRTLSAATYSPNGTHSVSTTSAGFAAQATANGILDQKDSRKPANVDALLEVINRRRHSPPPDQADYNRHVHAVAGAPNKATIVYETSKLLKDYQADNDIGYRRVFDQAFTAYPHSLPFNQGLCTPWPDIIEGLRADEFKPFPVNDILGGTAVLVRNFKSSVTLPHFVGRFKGPGGNLHAALTQAAFDAAHLVHGRNQALEHLSNPDTPGHSTVFSFTSDGTALNTYAHYAAESKSESETLPRTEYHTHLLTTSNLTPSFDSFEQGRRHLRNLQDLAKSHSYALKDQLLQHWKANPIDITTTPNPLQTNHVAPSSLQSLATPPPSARDLFAVPGDRSPRSVKPFFPDPNISGDAKPAKPRLDSGGGITLLKRSALLKTHDAQSQTGRDNSTAPAPASTRVVRRRPAVECLRKVENLKGVDVITISDDED